MTPHDSPVSVEPGSSDSTGPSPNRRRVLYGGVAAAAAVGGAGLAWWKVQPHAVSAGTQESLWGMTFERPEGGSLAMSSLQGKPLLINFWATWCPPCVEELPLLNRFYEEHAAHGWQVLGLAIDQPSSVRKFLARLPLQFPVGLAGLEGTELGRSLGNATGGLPFTVVLGSDGAVRHRKIGQVSATDLSDWAKKT